MSEYGRTVFNEIDAWLQTPGAEKTAGKVEQSGDPDKTTTHPVKGVDGGTQPATEGERSSENEADTKSSVPDSVDETPESINEPGGAGGEDTPVLEIGVSAKSTGEDPASEDPDKATKDDPGTTHPAEAGTEKYAGLIESGNEILAEIAVAGAVQKRANDESADPPPAETPPAAEKSAETPPAETPPVGAPPAAEKSAETPPAETPPVETPPAEGAEKSAEEKSAMCSECSTKDGHKDGCSKSKEKTAAAEAGEEAAGTAIDALKGDGDVDFSKMSNEQVIGQIHKSAAADADNVATYLKEYEQATKAAMGEEALLGAGGGEIPPEALEAAMAGMAGAGGGEGAPPMAPPGMEAGMAPPGAGAGMAPPGAGAGMAPPGAEEGLAAGGGEADTQAAIDELVQAILSSDVDVNQLIAALEGAAGGAAGAEAVPPPVEAGGEAVPPPAAVAAGAEDEGASVADEEKEAAMRKAGALEAFGKLTKEKQSKVVKIALAQAFQKTKEQAAPKA